jgi:hypothetical protein
MMVNLLMESDGYNHDYCFPTLAKDGFTNQAGNQNLFLNSDLKDGLSITHIDSRLMVGACSLLKVKPLKASDVNILRSCICVGVAYERLK